MLASEQAPQFELIESSRQRGKRAGDLVLLGLVVEFAGQLVQHLGIGEVTSETVVDVDVVFDGGVVAVDLLGPLGIVPQVGTANLGFEFDEAVPGLLDAEIAGCFGDATRATSRSSSVKSRMDGPQL